MSSISLGRRFYSVSDVGPSNVGVKGGVRNPGTMIVQEKRDLRAHFSENHFFTDSGPENPQKSTETIPKVPRLQNHTSN